MPVCAKEIIIGMETTVKNAQMAIIQTSKISPTLKIMDQDALHAEAITADCVLPMNQDALNAYPDTIWPKIDSALMLLDSVTPLPLMFRAPSVFAN